jgi:hypothetical protein
MTGIAGETIVWFVAATSIPSMSPTKMTFRCLLEPLFATDPPSVLHRFCQVPQQVPQLLMFFLIVEGKHQFRGRLLPRVNGYSSIPLGPRQPCPTAS